jgi:putative heme-binding domain-containing protein
LGCGAPELRNKEARIAGVLALLSKAKGDAAAGHELFKTLCATCHTLKGEGGKIGPDLTGYERDNLGFLLPSIVDPSLNSRRRVRGLSCGNQGRSVFDGYLVENTPQSVTSIIAKNDNGSARPVEETRSIACLSDAGGFVGCTE